MRIPCTVYMIYCRLDLFMLQICRHCCGYFNSAICFVAEYRYGIMAVSRNTFLKRHMSRMNHRRVMTTSKLCTCTMFNVRTVKQFSLRFNRHRQFVIVILMLCHASDIDDHGLPKYSILQQFYWRHLCFHAYTLSRYLLSSAILPVKIKHVR